jgi:hypothetical protein
VGGEIDAFCTRCKMTLAHTILAMVGSKVARVRCNTCNGDHVYRNEPGARRSAPSKPREKKVVVSFEQRLDGKDVANAPTYSPKETYALDQVLQHSTFGVGIVTAVRTDKIDVAFKADVKTLIHGRSGGAGAKPAFTPPAARRDGPADKPMAEVAAGAPEAAPAESTDEIPAPEAME